MGFCLPKEFTDKFVQALRDGRINPDKLSAMSSEERRGYLGDIVGKDNAADVNALFESKLLLKNQQQGMVNWAKQIAGIKENVRRDIISRIEKMDTILNAKDEQAFLEDLASKKLGTTVTFDEAKNISTLSKELAESRDSLSLKPTDPIGSEARLDYGSKLVALQEYVNGLKIENSKTTLQGTIDATKTSPVGALRSGISKLAGIAKGIKASLDDSALFRQGWKTIFTNPTSWAKNALKSFADIARQLKLKPSDNQIINGIKADIYSRPNALNGLYKDMKLDIGTGEEAFPTSIPERIPIFGRLYKASETAYQGFLYRMRADIADAYIKIAKVNNIDLTNPLQVRSIGRLVNSLTGRGDLGSFEKVGKEINTIFFSPKMLKSSIDFLTVHAFDKMSVFARKQAALNLLKVVTGTAVILATAKAIDNKSVELDPRSSDFGKIKVGNTRFDVTAGMAGVVTLASRIITMSSKSTFTHKVTPLNSGKFGSKTALDVAFDFGTNKTSPFASVIVDILRGHDFAGKKPTVIGETKNLFAPLPITNAEEALRDPNSANDLLIMILDGLGIVTNTYSDKKKK